MLGDVIIAEKHFRSELITDEAFERAYGWRCPSCTTNPPRPGGRLAVSARRKGAPALRIHLLMHRFEAMRHLIILDAIRTEERILRRRFEEEEQAEFLYVAHREFCTRQFSRHGAIVIEQHTVVSKKQREQQSVKEQQMSQEWIDILEIIERHQSIFRFQIEEEQKRQRIVIDYHLQSYFCYFGFRRVGSPSAHVPFEAVIIPPPSSHDLAFFQFFETDKFRTLRQQFDARFVKTHVMCTEEQRVADVLPPQEHYLPRGINRFNIEQLLADPGMEDESSFLPVAMRTGDDAYVANLSFIGSFSLFDEHHGGAAGAGRPHDSRDIADLAEARAFIRKRINTLVQFEVASRRRIEAVEQERRSRLALSRANLFGMDRRAATGRANPRLEVQIALLVSGEEKQRQNLCDVELLSFSRLARVFDELGADAVASKARTTTPPPQQQQQSRSTATVHVGVPASLRASRRRSSSVSPSPPRRRSTIFGSNESSSLVVRRPSVLSTTASVAASATASDTTKTKTKIDAAQIFEVYGGDPFEAIEQQVRDMMAMVERKREMLCETLSRFPPRVQQLHQRSVTSAGFIPTKPEQQHQQQGHEQRKPRRATVVTIVPSPPPERRPSSATRRLS